MRLRTDLPTDLPGRFHLAPASRAEYDQLARFHYRPGRPATIAAVQAAWFIPRFVHCNDRKHHQLAAVAVLSYPTALCRERHVVFGMTHWSFGDRLRFVNRELRTISRVIVHPQFRAVGLATRLVQQLCEACPTRYVEALAAMGRVHPFFERAGMTRVDPAHASRPVYFHLDRTPTEDRT